MNLLRLNDVDDFLNVLQELQNFTLWVNLNKSNLDTLTSAFNCIDVIHSEIKTVIEAKSPRIQNLEECLNVLEEVAYYLEKGEGLNVQHDLDEICKALSNIDSVIAITYAEYLH